jgi:hypothetical protein
MTDTPTKSLGSAIDEIIAALTALPETARLTAIRAACDNVGLPFDTLAKAPTLSGGSSPGIVDYSSRPTPTETEESPRDIRSLKEAKNPRSNPEMACVMAYYLQVLAPATERKAVVSASDVQKYFAQAGFPLPKAPGQVLVDAKSAGYFDAVGRGTYKLNPVGHNLVVHGLPKKAGATVSKPGKSRASRPARKPTAKKAR